MQQRFHQQPGHVFYVTTDIGLTPETLLPNSLTKRVYTCSEFGCPAGEQSDIFWALVENAVCSSAQAFVGNVYSTFSLGICAARNDQGCHDLFDMELGDGRLLF